MVDKAEGCLVSARYLGNSRIVGEHSFRVDSTLLDTDLGWIALRALDITAGLVVTSWVVVRVRELFAQRAERLQKYQPGPLEHAAGENQQASWAAAEVIQS